MLNLVQLQERLKDVPIQALMQYANGANPQIPPFLALGELNRRKKMQEGAAAQQAQEMEGAPSIKQQIEQATGLLALQGSRQRQAAQQQQGLQANMPMAAPNTTTSEPAQLAGGGFVEDIVVPRDYQAGGPAMNPEVLKRLMMLKAMKQRRPGIAGLQTPPDMFKRSDFAGGGIVAFAGPDGSFVETSPGFHQLKEETDQADEYPTIENLTDEERLKRIRELQRLAGVKQDPYSEIKQLYSKIGQEDLRRRKEQPMDQLMSFLSGIAEGRGGNWATQGARGAKAAMQLQAEQASANRRQDMDMAALQMSFAKEEDARARGDAAAVIAEKDKQNKLQMDIAAAKRQSKYYNALTEQALAGRSSEGDRAAQAYLKSQKAKGDTRPDDVILSEGYMAVFGARGAAAARATTGAEATDVETVNKARDNVDARLKIYTSPEARELMRLKGQDKKNADAGNPTNLAEEYRQQLYRNEEAALRRQPVPPRPTGGSAPQSSQTDPLGIRR